MKLFCPECQTTYEDASLEFCPHDNARLFSLEAEAADPLMGAIIDGRFRIDHLLGKGGMGAVYQGVQLSVNRKVAVKVLRTELLDREVALERFYRESKIISGLSHPNIVRLVDFGQDRERDMLYLVMELVDGLNLGDLLERGRMRVAMALEIVYQVCGALTEPHKFDVIHRDLKPDNLLLVPVSDGTLQVKVLDFGIARALEGNAQLTQTGMVCGTPQYMAPEQAQNMPIGPSTDLYALGVMLYEMLSGIPPFRGNNSLQIMLQQIQVAPSPLAAMLPPGALPPEVEDLVNDMLSKEPTSRPQSARDVRDRIDRIRRDYNLDFVRINPDEAREHMFDTWMLEALPAANGAATGTQSLRRESGLERKPSTHSTDEREAAFAETEHAPVVETGLATTPVPEAKRVEILADANRNYTPPTPAATPSAQPLRQTNPTVPPPLEERGPAFTQRHDLAPSPVDATLPAMSHTPETSSGGRGSLMAMAGVLGVLIFLACGAIVALAFQGKDDGEDPVPVVATPQVTPLTDTPKADPPKVDPPKVGTPTKVDPPKADPPKVDPPKADPPKITKVATSPPKKVKRTKKKGGVKTPPTVVKGSKVKLTPPDELFKKQQLEMERKARELAKKQRELEKKMRDKTRPPKKLTDKERKLKKLGNMFGP